MQIFTNILAFVFALGVIVFVHELGHFVVAKAFGCRVLTFSLGWGKRLWGFQRGETDYRVALFPIGGYVQLAGEDPTDVDPNDDRHFFNKPRWQRVLVYLAGPAMNVLLSIGLIAVLFMVGIEMPGLQRLEPVIGSVVEGSPGEAAGLAAGDRVLSVDGGRVDDWDDVQFSILASAGRELSVEIERQGSRRTLLVTPAEVPKYEIGDAGIFPQFVPRVTMVEGGSPAERGGLRVGDELRSVDRHPVTGSREFIDLIQARGGQPAELGIVRDGESMSVGVTPDGEAGAGRIGIGLGVYQRFGPVKALGESVRYNWQLATQTVDVIGRIATGRMAAKSALSGPVEIAALSGAAARSGVKNLLYLMGLVSISIGLLNLLPIPVLDGGQILLLSVESLMRRDLSMTFKERFNQVGFVMIMALMVAVLYLDLSKNWPEWLTPG